MQQPAAPEVVVLCSDLFFSSAIEGTAAQHAVHCRVTGSMDELIDLLKPGTVRLVIVDLEFPELVPHEIISRLPQSDRPATIAFGPHVRTEQLKAARSAGFDTVLPRSQFSEQLAAILKDNR